MCCLPCRVPRCRLCEKKARKAFFRLSQKEKEEWTFTDDDQLVCTKCVYQMEKGEFNPSKRGLLSSRRRMLETVSGLKKIRSGKVWERSTSFNEPYKEAPSVTKKVSKVKAGAIDETYKRDSSVTKQLSKRGGGSDGVNLEFRG